MCVRGARLNVKHRQTATDFLLPLIDIPRPDRADPTPTGAVPDLPPGDRQRRPKGVVPDRATCEGAVRRTGPLSPAKDWQAEVGKIKPTKRAAPSADEPEAPKEAAWKRTGKAVLRFLKSRNFKKTVTWRITAFADTTFFTHLLTKQAGKGAIIGILEAITKTGIKYFHEKYWNNVDPNEERLIARAISYRVIAGVDTFLLALLVTGSPAAAGGLVGLEFVSKAILHWVHDKAWKKFAPAESDEPRDQASSVVADSSGASGA